ncbi:MAG: MmgE/PrpD family protein [Planctomycetales bacterium]
MSSQSITLPHDSNQALEIGRFAIDFISGRNAPPSDHVIERLEQFHLDSIACAVSAIALDTNAPKVLRAEALRYQGTAATATCFGSTVGVAPEKAVVANSAAVREWDANGTNFGYNPALQAIAGEFGHNDFYPVVIAAAQVARLDGRQAVLGMLLLDEIRGRLAEVFSLKDYKIDHVLHGAIASAAVYGALVGASAAQIESAIGMLVSHYIPYRAIRAGNQLSDSKGSSAAICAEVAVLSVQRSMDGFEGPRDIFRNPQALFCLNSPPAGNHSSPFDLTLSTAGDDFAVMGMHFKLGLYEHQSAGAIQALIDLLDTHPDLFADPSRLRQIKIAIYQPAFGIICDPAKRNPQTRQSADHSMVYIIAALMNKAHTTGKSGWKELMLMPADYDSGSLQDPQIRALIDKIEVIHGGPQYDEKYPDGIPTSLDVEHHDLGTMSSGLIMYPTGHARNTRADLDDLLDFKFHRLAALGVSDTSALQSRFTNLSAATVEDIARLNDFEILRSP